MTEAKKTAEASCDGKRYYLSACLIAKNEGRYLLEWIAFHMSVGFEHFYIYNNDSTDDTSFLLQALQKNGLCTYINWPRDNHPENPQVNAYRHMLHHYGSETSWVAIIDADEFVVPAGSDRVDEILRKHFSEASSVLCNWRVFGSSGLLDDDGRFCIERFRRSSDESYHSNNHLKSICKPELVDQAYVHNHYMKTGPVVLSDGMPFLPENDQLTSSPTYGFFHINHYFCKSLAEFKKKRNKGLAEYPLDHPTAIRSMNMFYDADRNEVENDSAFRFLEKTKECHRYLQDLIYKTVDNNKTSDELTPRVRTTIASSVMRAVLPPVFHKAVPTHHANLMIQYMVAIKLRSMIPHLILSDFNLPDWGISNPFVHPHCYRRRCELSPEHHVEFVRIQYLANTGAFDYFNWHGYGQRMDNFPQREICRSLFHRNDIEGENFGDDFVVCPIRGAEVLTAVHPGYPVVPADFYEDVISTSGLRPVFIGQISDNIYTSELRRRFPDAIFIPSMGPIGDFQTIRNSANIILSISTFAWLAAWLSDAKTIVMPLFGIFDRKSFPYHDLVPIADDRYSFFDFPAQEAVRLEQLVEAHRRISGQWSATSPSELVRF